MKPVILSCWALTLVTLGGCSLRSAAPKADGGPVVIVAHPLMQSSTTGLVLNGQVAASEAVDLYARVPGTLRGKYFADGAYVHKGQLLFTIEPDLYRAQLDGDRARQKQAEQDYARQKQLLADDATTPASVENSAANVGQAKANTRIGEINLSYTAVRAPFDGWINAAAAYVGAYVGAGGAPTRLATVIRVSPLYVNFSLGERDLLKVLANKTATNSKALHADVGLQNEVGFSHHGYIDFANKTVDSTTGTLAVRAVIPNLAKQPALPGLYARVRVQSAQPVMRMLVPDRLIQSDALGDYVLVIDRADKVARVDVITGEGIGQYRAILGGLKPGDQMVVEGLINVRIGQRVQTRPTVLPAVSEG